MQNTAAYGDGNPHTPAQVTIPPAQQHLLHRIISIAFPSRRRKRILSGNAS